MPSWKNNDRVSTGGTLVSSGLTQSCVFQENSYLQNTIPSPSIPSIKEWEVGELWHPLVVEEWGSSLGILEHLQEHGTILGASTCYAYPSYDGIITKTYKEYNKFREMSTARKRGWNFCQEAGMKQPL